MDQGNNFVVMSNQIRSSVLKLKKLYSNATKLQRRLCFCSKCNYSMIMFQGIQCVVRFKQQEHWLRLEKDKDKFCVNFSVTA